MHRDAQFAVELGHLRLLLPDEDEAVAGVLRPELDHVRSPLRGVEQQGEAETRHRPDAVPRFELRNLGLAPRVNGAAFGLTLGDALGRVAVDIAAFDREPHEPLQRLQPIVAGERLQPREQAADDMTLLQVCAGDRRRSSRGRAPIAGGGSTACWRPRPESFDRGNRPRSPPRCCRAERPGTGARCAASAA